MEFLIKMRHLIILLCALLFSSCSVVNKLFKKEKTKVEFSEIKHEKLLEQSEVQVEMSTYEFTSEEIKNVLSELNFSYFGENNDSAQIELTKNDKSISVKIKGKAVADFKTTEKEKTETNNQVAETSQKVDYLNYREIDKNHEITLKEKTKEEEKKKNKFDFPIWFWLLIGIIALYLLFIGRINRINS